jgi:hypothetical protein
MPSDKKISQLDEKTSLENNDYTVIIDHNDNTTKKVQALVFKGDKGDTGDQGLPGIGWQRDATNGWIFPTFINDWVGIGTNTPLAKLDVQGGDANFSDSLFIGGNISIGTTNQDNNLTVGGGIDTNGENHFYQGTYFDPVDGTLAAAKFSQNASTDYPSAPFTSGINGVAGYGLNTYAGYFNNVSTVSGGGINYGLYVIGQQNYFGGAFKLDDSLGLNTALEVDNISDNGANLFQFSSGGILRSSLPWGGAQDWYLNSGFGEAGKIAYSTPGGFPGIIMWNYSDGDYINRFNTALMNGGVGYGADPHMNFQFDSDSGGSSFGKLGLNIFPNGLVSINSNTAINPLDVYGSVAIGTYGGINAAPANGLIVSGKVGFGLTSPTALLHLKAGTATANTAPLKFTSGVKLTTPEAGTIEFDGTDFFITI